MKKAISILLISFIFLISGCGGSSVDNKQTTEPTTSPTATTPTPTEAPVNKRENTLDNITITITDASIQPVIGDRTVDNYAEDNGEYFAIGSDIVKASDYEQIILKVKIQNNSDKAMFFSSMGWKASLNDGYIFKDLEVTGKLNEQMPSNYSGEGEIKIIKEKALTVKELKLSYGLLDYNEEFSEYLRDIVFNGLTEEQAKNKYGDKFVPKEMNFEITF